MAFQTSNTGTKDIKDTYTNNKKKQAIVNNTKHTILKSPTSDLRCKIDGSTLD